MTEEIRALAQVSRGLRHKRTLEMLLKEARVWGARQTLLRKALQRLDTNATDALLAEAARIDGLIKGAGLGDPWDECLRLGLRLCIV